MKLWKKIIIGLLIVILSYASFALIQARSLDVEKLSDDLWVIRGMGSNATVLRTDEGAVIVDSMTFPMQGKLIRNKVRELTGSEPVMIINTHYHLDHTHGNPGFDPSIRVVSTERTLSHLTVLDADFWQGKNEKLMPKETFSGSLELSVGGKTLQLMHPGRGHTDGDLVVLIEDENTMVMGDLFFNNYYPNIDLEAGGSIQEWSKTLDTILESKFEQVIPGHGATSNRLGIRNYQRFIGQLAQIGLSAMADESSLEDVLQSDRLAADEGYQSIRFAGISLGLNREFVLTRAWQETTGNFTLKN